MHSDFLPTAASPSLWREEFLLTREEIAHGLYMTDPRKAGKVRILVESIVLVAAALYFLIGWLTSEQKTANGPILALTSLFVLVLLVFGPKLQAENIARRTVKNGQPVIVRGYEGALGFGEGEHFTAAAFDEFSVKYDETVFALQFSAGQLVLIPRRAVSAETWNWLCTQLVTPEGE